MTTKSAGKKAETSTASSKKAPAKGADSPKAEAKMDKKAKAAAAESEIDLVDGAAPAVDVDALEEQEEEAEASAAASSGGGNAAALAAASGTEMSASFKNFRHHPDMENFYRFIYENDLRVEALQIMDEMMNEKLNRRMAKSSKAQAH